MKAEATKRQRAQAGDWWRQRGMWNDNGLPHSTTEAAAIESLRKQAGGYAVDLIERWGVEALRDAIRELRADTPLRELHARRGAHADWIELAPGRWVTVIVEAA